MQIEKLYQELAGYSYTYTAVQHTCIQQCCRDGNAGSIHTAMACMAWRWSHGGMEQLAIATF